MATMQESNGAVLLTQSIESWDPKHKPSPIPIRVVLAPDGNAIEIEVPNADGTLQRSVFVENDRGKLVVRLYAECSEEPLVAYDLTAEGATPHPV